METYILLTYSLTKLGGIFNHIATTNKESDTKQIKEGMCVGDDMFKWAKVVKKTKYDEYRIAVLDNEQLIYNFTDPDFPCWMTKEEFSKHSNFDMYYGEKDKG